MYLHIPLVLSNSRYHFWRERYYVPLQLQLQPSPLSSMLSLPPPCLYPDGIALLHTLHDIIWIQFKSCILTREKMDWVMKFVSWFFQVQHLIERCLLLHMSRDECVKALAHHANIRPLVTLTGPSQNFMLLSLHNQISFVQSQLFACGCSVERAPEREHGILPRLFQFYFSQAISG